jgi:hypothetical protein
MTEQKKLESIRHEDVAIGILEDVSSRFPHLLEKFGNGVLRKFRELPNGEREKPTEASIVHLAAHVLENIDDKNFRLEYDKHTPKNEAPRPSLNWRYSAPGPAPYGDFFGSRTIHDGSCYEQSLCELQAVVSWSDWMDNQSMAKTMEDVETPDPDLELQLQDEREARTSLFKRVSKCMPATLRIDPDGMVLTCANGDVRNLIDCRPSLLVVAAVASNTLQKGMTLHHENERCWYTMPIRPGFPCNIRIPYVDDGTPYPKAIAELECICQYFEHGWKRVPTSDNPNDY